MRFFRRVTLVAGLIVASSYISAQNVDGHILDSLVVTESRLRTVTESSSPLQRLSGEDIRRLGVSNVGDAMKHLSGVAVRDYGGVGGMKTVGIRGLGAQHTAVFYDGVAVGDCQSGQVDLGRYSTDNIAGVELLIGQADEIYRSARMLAAAGVISLETKGGAVAEDCTASLRAGSYGSYKGSLSYGRSLRKGWGVSAFGEYVTSQGDYSFKIKNPATTVSGRRDNSDIEELRGEVNGVWQPSDVHLLRMKIYAYGYDRGLPGSVVVNNPVNTDRLHGNNIFGQLFYEYVPSSQLKMKFALKHNETYDRHREPRVGSVVVNSYRQSETDFSGTLMWNPAFVKGLSMAWSEEVFRNALRTTNSHVAMPTRPERLTMLSAASLRYGHRFFSLTASLLHTYAAESAPGGNVAPDRSRFSPSLALCFYPVGSEDFCLRASYKSIFRMPTFNDLYYREVGNYKLAPEKTRQYNLGAAYSMRPLSWCSELTLSADAYYGRIDDKIVAVPGVFVWKMSNVDRVETLGADVDAKALFRISSSSSLRLSSSYSYMRAVNRTAGSPLRGEQIVYTPLHSGNADVSVSTPLVDAGYTLLWSGKRYHLAKNVRSNEIGAYGDHSLWLSRRWTVGGCRLLTRAEVRNIGDRNYEIIRYYPMPGRNYSFTIILTL